MSVHAISWVLRNSKERLGNRIVLIVLADHAHADGTNAWPSVKTIASESVLSERNVRYALRALEESGAIERTGRHESGTFIYSIAGVQDLPGGQSLSSDVSDIAPKPSEPSVPLEEHPGRTDSQSLVAHYVEYSSALGDVLTAETKGQTARAVGKLVKEGVGFDLIRRALELQAEKGKHPSILHALVQEVQAGDRNGNGKRSGMTFEDIMAADPEAML